MKAIDTSDDQTFTIDVTPENDAPTVANAIANQLAVKDTDFSFTIPGDSFIDVDEDDSLTYSATLADGTALPGWLMFEPATQMFSGRPAESDIAALDITVTATDSATASVRTNFQLDVAAEQPPRLTAGNQAGGLELTSLGDAKSLRFSFDDFGIEGVGELRIFGQDAEGNKTQLSSFFTLDGSKLANGYSTSFSIDSDELSAGEQLQFELVENGRVRTGTLSLRDDSTALFDFGDNTQLTIALNNEDTAPNLLREDATTIDLTGFDSSSDVTLNFSVYREASYDNTVGFYRADSAEGGIQDAMTGDMLMPGDDGYEDAAMSRQLDVQLSGQNGEMTTFSSTMAGGDFLGMFIISDGNDVSSDDVLFSAMGMNSGTDHVKMLGNNTFGFEDTVGGGDQDFNDMVVKVEVA